MLREEKKKERLNVSETTYFKTASIIIIIFWRERYGLISFPGPSRADCL